jgi:uncharacterized protein YjeT (DUF2065 family)
MNSVIAFLLFCIPTRILIAYTSQYIPDKYLGIYGIILLAIGIAFLYLFFTNGRTNAPEAGGITWWAQYRILLGMLWITAAIYAFKGKKNLIWIPLAIDILFGIVLFTIKHTKPLAGKA